MHAIANKEDLFNKSTDFLADAGSHVKYPSVKAVADFLATIPTLPTLTAGSIPFFNGTGLAQDNDNLFWDSVNKRAGFGTKLPTATIHAKAQAGVNNVSRFESQTANNLNQFVSTAGIGEYGIWNDRFYFQNVSTTGGLGFYGSNVNRLDLAITAAGRVKIGAAAGETAALNVDSGSNTSAALIEGTEASGNGINLTVRNKATGVGSFATYAMFTGNDQKGGVFFGSRTAVDTYGIANGITFRAQPGQDIGFTAAPAFGALSGPSVTIKSGGNVIVGGTSGSARLYVVNANNATTNRVCEIDNTYTGTGSSSTMRVKQRAQNNTSAGSTGFTMQSEVFGTAVNTAVTSVVGGEYFNIFRADSKNVTIGSSVGLNLRSPSIAELSGGVVAITNSIGSLVNNQGSAKVVNSYALKIDAQSGSSAKSYAIYSEGGNSYHKGWFGIDEPNPTSSLHVTGLPIYEDNAAAIAGGHTAGAFYRTATGELRVTI